MAQRGIYMCDFYSANQSGPGSLIASDDLVTYDSVLDVYDEGLTASSTTIRIVSSAGDGNLIAVSNKGLASSPSSFNCTFFHSSDWGSTWTDMNANPGTYTNHPTGYGTTNPMLLHNGSLWGVWDNDTDKMKTSANGITWTTKGAMPTSYSIYTDIAYFNSRWIMTSYDNSIRVIYSTNDMTSWNNCTGLTSFSSEMRAGRFVQSGTALIGFDDESASIWRSTTGAAWTKITDSTNPALSNFGFSGIAGALYDGTVFWIYDNAGWVLKSTNDGLTWTEAELSGFLTNGDYIANTSYDKPIAQCFYVNGLYALVTLEGAGGSEKYVYTSADNSSFALSSLVVPQSIENTYVNLATSTLSPDLCVGWTDKVGVEVI